jgi:2,3-bisphosphoglycerate-dependent phosphoglycerate mutase
MSGTWCAAKGTLQYGITLMDGPHTTLYLVRHAQSHPTSKLDEPDWPLSRLGVEQAKQLPRLLEPLGIGKIVSSPYIRCLNTIGPFARKFSIDIEIHEDLRERRITGELRQDFEGVMRRSWEDFSYALPGCENSQDAQERMGRTIDQIVRDYPGQTVAVSSHGNAIGLYLNSLDPTFGHDEMFSIRNPDVVKLEATGSGVTHDSSFELPGLQELSSHHRESPIDW